MLRDINPLQLIADSRFYLLLARAFNRNRVVPSPSKPRLESERSSWSSASVVSSIDLRSPEPPINNEVVIKLEAINEAKRSRTLTITVIILIILITSIIIVLAIVLPLKLIQNYSAETTTILTSTTTKI